MTDLLDLMQDAVLCTPRKIKGEQTMDTGSKAEAYYERSYTITPPTAPVYTRSDIIRAFIAGYDRARYDVTELLVDLETSR